MHKVEEKKVAFAISLDKPVYEAVQALATADQRSMAFIVREAVEAYIASRRGDGTPGGALIEAATKPGAKPLTEILPAPSLRKTLVDYISRGRQRALDSIVEIPGDAGLVPAKEPARGRGRKS